MRYALSVAWFSTAGFHHLSKWMTWFAAVRVSPVPPAFKEIKNTEKSIKEEPIIEKAEVQEEQVSEAVGDFDVLLPEEPKETEEITTPKPKGRRKKNS